jgi:radical SAM protein with 4Fe4S-binding SPASM domain
MPLKLWIETSSKCNLRCPLCVNRKLGKDEKKDMDFELFKKIIDQIAGRVHNVNLFHRGEPLMNPEIADMIKYASRAELKTSLHTNGTMLEGEVSRQILHSGLDYLSFSFDGYSPDIYERNRKGAEFDKTLSNIRSFLKQKKDSKLKIPFTVIQVMGKKNTREKIRFKKNFEGLPLDRLTERQPHNWGGLVKSDSKGNDIGLCTFPWYSLTILYNGRVSICPQDFLGKLIVGDLEKESLSDIFNGKKMTFVRKEMISKTFYKQKPCLDCDRIRRRNLLGVPSGNIKAFLRENLTMRRTN